MMRILSIFVFLGYTAQCNSEPYYGYAGSCNDGIYIFDFDNSQYTGYLQHRVVGAEWQYQIINKPLEKKGTNTYIMGYGTDDPLMLKLTSDISMIHGKSLKNGYTFYYEQCDESLALDIIKKAKNYESKPPNHAN